VAFSMRLKARVAPTESGVSPLRLSRSCFKRASSRLKRTVGGPKRSEGLPNRGPLGLSTASLMEAKLAMLSDGELAIFISSHSAVRTAGNEYVQKSRKRGVQPLVCIESLSTSSWGSMASMTALISQESYPRLWTRSGRTLGSHSYNVDFSCRFIVCPLWKGFAHDLKTPHHGAWAVFADPVVNLL